MMAQSKFTGRISDFEVTIDASKDFLHFFLFSGFSVFETKIQKPSSLFKQMIKFFKNSECFIEFVNNYSQNEKYCKIDEWNAFCVRKYDSSPYLKFPTKRITYQTNIQSIGLITRQIHQSLSHNKIIKQLIVSLKQQQQSINSYIYFYRNQLCLQKQKLIRHSNFNQHQIVNQFSENIHQAQNYKSNQSASVLRNLTKLQNQIRSLKQRLFELQKPTLLHPTNDAKGKYGNQFYVTIDRNNKFLSDHFQVVGQSIKKINKYCSVQVLGRQIFPQGRSHYYLYARRIHYKIFSVGICDKSLTNVQASFTKPLCVAYFAKTGAIWEEGVCRGGGPSIGEGAELRVVVDRLARTIKWYKDEIEIGSTLLSQQLAMGWIVPYVQINYVGDHVYFNVKPLLHEEQGQINV